MEQGVFGLLKILVLNNQAVNALEIVISNGVVVVTVFGDLHGNGFRLQIVDCADAGGNAVDNAVNPSLFKFIIRQTVKLTVVQTSLEVIIESVKILFNIFVNNINGVNG